MDFINTLLPTIETWFERFITVQNGVQLLTVVICGALAFFTAKKWRIITNKLLSDDDKHTVIQFVLRASNRVAFPVSMLLYLISTSFVIEQLGVDAKVLDVFTPLLLSMAAITFSIYVLRKGFRPSPALRAWENFISLFIWGLVALHLIGWLPDVIQGLDNLAINFGNSRFSMLSLLQLFIAIIFFAVLANWLTRLIESNTHRSPHLNPSMRVILTKISKFSFYGLAILLAPKGTSINCLCPLRNLKRVAARRESQQNGYSILKARNAADACFRSRPSGLYGQSRLCGVLS